MAAPGMLGNDSDPDGDGLTASVVSGPSNGVLVPNADGSFNYLPSPLFVGTDSFVYAASDGVTSTQATVVINVANAAPTSADDGPYAATEDTALTVPAPGVLANDTDDDGDALSAVLVAGPSNGTVTLDADGSFVYVPAADFNGPDAFTYRAADGLDTSPVTTVSILVAAVDDPPAAAADAFVASEDTALTVPGPGVLGNDTEVDGDPVAAALVAPPRNGQLVLDADGGFDYLPDPNFHGVDSFTYAIDDGVSSATAVVTLTVSPINDAPLGAADASGTAHATSVLIDVLANDTDVDGDPLTVSAVGAPSVGAVAIESNRIRYTPPPGFAGSATFTYTLTDGAASDTASVAVVVSPEPAPAPTSTPAPPEPTPRATPMVATDPGPVPPVPGPVPSQ
ncbi:MAG TPA: Ig-like domain-containing protein, partial [Vitreimonas sp.]|nr:Ig-like domain-containing protein [Vitreimonas sp.]